MACRCAAGAAARAAHEASMTTWFTSDTHFGHTNIVSLGPGRPFDSIEEHDAALIDAWNARVRPGDDVWHLGDFSIKASVAQAAVSLLNGRVHLVAGNHDVCWTSHPNAKYARRAVGQVERYLAAGFASVHGSGIVRGVQVAGQEVVLAHLPARGDHSAEDRYAAQRPNPGRLPLVHGHVHHLWRVRERQVNVGVDHWGYAPVSEDELAEVLRSL